MNTVTEEEFNTALGQRLMLLRVSRKVSQEYLATRIGVRSQQIHKYETGESRMPPGRIYACAKIFEVPVGYFFYGEEDGDNPSRFNKAILNVAAEILELPPEIRLGVYNLTRIINKLWKEESNDNAVAAGQDRTE